MNSEPVIIMNAVESSNVNKVGYDETAQILQVEFKNGGVYRYKAVPKDMYDAMLTAPSIGSFIAKCIKGYFESEKAQPEKDKIPENKS